MPKFGHIDASQEDLQSGSNLASPNVSTTTTCSCHYLEALRSPHTAFLTRYARSCRAFNSGGISTAHMPSHVIVALRCAVVTSKMTRFDGQRSTTCIDAQSRTNKRTRRSCVFNFFGQTYGFLLAATGKKRNMNTMSLRGRSIFLALAHFVKPFKSHLPQHRGVRCSGRFLRQATV